MTIGEKFLRRAIWIFLARWTGISGGENEAMTAFASKSKDRLRMSTSRVLALLCLFLLAYTLLCTMPLTPTHNQSSSQQSEHRGTPMGCIVNFLGSQAGEQLLEHAPLQTALLPLASLPDLFSSQLVIPDLRSVAGVAAFRAVSQVQQHVLQLI